MPGTLNPLCAIHLTPSDKEYTNAAEVQDEFEVLVPGSFPRTAVSVALCWAVQRCVCDKIPVMRFAVVG